MFSSMQVMLDEANATWAVKTVRTMLEEEADLTGVQVLERLEKIAGANSRAAPTPLFYGVGAGPGARIGPDQGITGMRVPTTGCGILAGVTNAADRASFGVLTQTFVPDLVQAVTTQGGALQQRRRELPAPLTLYLVLALWLWRNLSYKEVWRRLADGCAFTGPAPGLPVPASGAPEASSISRARERLGTHPLALLFDQTRGPLADAATPGAFWRGYH